MDVDDWFRDGNDPGWIAVYVLVALVLLAALAMIAARRKRERDLHRAHELRTEAQRHEPALRAKDAEARQLEAESEQARAEADRLEAVAEEKRNRFERERAEQERRLHEADKLDPREPGRHESRG
ncbi:hypothetical protein ACJ5H2_04435 [Nocardioides sp. R1-1]|uniref:hypothetical protein n=1 Tax=Nocardioides sp. R1-1 TaxID=3383502 RepID=UPI0038CF9109